MKKLILFAVLFFFVQAAQAAYVQSGKQNMASAASTACSPNSGTGSVTSGDMEVMYVWKNTATTTGISSTHVPSWTTDHDTASFSSYHGLATSSGAETITVNISGTHLLGSVCGEYSTSSVDQNTTGGGASTSITTLVAVTDVVTGSSCNGQPTTIASPFTTRQQAQNSGSTWLVLADVHETSTGTYTATSSCSAGINTTLTSYYTAVPASTAHAPPMM